MTPGMPTEAIGNYYALGNKDVEKVGFLRYLAFFAGLPAEHKQYQRDKYITLTSSGDSDMEVFTKDQENYFSLITEEYDYESATHISEDLAWELAKVRIASKDPNRPVPKTMKRRLSKLDVFKIAHLHNCSGLQYLTFNTTSTTSVDSSSQATSTTSVDSSSQATSTTSIDSSSQEQLGVDTTSTTTSKYKFTFEIDGFDGANNGGDFDGDNNGGDFDGANNGGDFDYSFSGTTTTSSAATKTTATRNGTVLLGNLDAQRLCPRTTPGPRWVEPYNYTRAEVGCVLQLHQG
ncbi:zinc metalloproteinase nas-14-like [Hyalella azteca]|uniref:Zinc metalloproteinase nas-14-like n=1 Tax=Hyalella azteca TaxID=294128 RepID=A0A8B7P896_HYAAZ|nr:zinc metalloproteinase nas-14-like [Hyalella azteca]